MQKKRILGQETKEVGDILGRFKKRDFSGNTGQAVKNSTFQFSTTLVSKVGSLIFTIVVARILLPELFGLYSLALSTILVFSAFSDLGISNTLIKFISSSKNNSKSKAYFSYLMKVKLILMSSAIVALFVSSYFIAYSYYNKPIFLALAVGALYILFSGFAGIFDGVFQSQNNFKKTFFKEIIFQSLRLTLVPLIILFTIRTFQTEVMLSSIFLVLSFAFLIALLFISISARKQIPFLKLKTNELDKKEKGMLNKFIVALSALTLSNVLFGYIDMIILGRFVEAEFIGYYRAAFSLIASAIPLITFSSALFPLFSRLKGKRLERGLKKSVRITFLIAVPSFILTFILSPLVVRIIFGPQYVLSSNILRLFSVLILFLPLISIYSSYLVSQNKPKRVTISLLASAILNIILNITFVFLLLPYGQLQAVYGVATATIISNIFYLVMLTWRR